MSSITTRALCEQLRKQMFAINETINEIASRMCELDRENDKLAHENGDLCDTIYELQESVKELGQIPR